MIRSLVTHAAKNIARSGGYAPLQAAIASPLVVSGVAAAIGMARASSRNTTTWAHLGGFSPFLNKTYKDPVNARQMSTSAVSETGQAVQEVSQPEGWALSSHLEYV